MSAARSKALQQNSGAGVASRLNPVQGYRDSLARAGKKVTNHAIINRNLIKSKQEQKQQEKADELAESMTEKFKMQRFKNVEGRAMKKTLEMTSKPAQKLHTSSAPRLHTKSTISQQEIESDIEQDLSDYENESPVVSAQSSPQPQHHHQQQQQQRGHGQGQGEESIFSMNTPIQTSHPTTLGIKSISRSPSTGETNVGTIISKSTSSASSKMRTSSAPKPRVTKSNAEPVEPRRERVKTKEPVPRADEALPPTVPPSVNHIVANTRAAVRGSNAAAARAAKPKSEQKERDTDKSDYGKVPQYLLDRKIELAEAEEKRREANKKSDVPPGMVLMSEEERVKTVAVLQTNLGRVMSDLASFPLTVETESRKRRKLELENKVKEIEHALTLFNRKKVYITA